MTDPYLCICGHYAVDHYSLGHPDRGGLRLGGCSARRHDPKTGLTVCDCQRFDAYAGYADAVTERMEEKHG